MDKFLSSLLGEAAIISSDSIFISVYKHGHLYPSFSYLHQYWP